MNDDRVLMNDLKNSIIPVMKDLVLVVVSETNPIAGCATEAIQFITPPTKVTINCIYGMIPTIKVPIVDVRNVTTIIIKNIIGIRNITAMIQKHIRKQHMITIVAQMNTTITTLRHAVKQDIAIIAEHTNNFMNIQKHTTKQDISTMAEHTKPTVPHINPIITSVNDPAQGMATHTTIKITANRSDRTNIIAPIITTEHSEHPTHTKHSTYRQAQHISMHNIGHPMHRHIHEATTDNIDRQQNTHPPAIKGAMMTANTIIVAPEHVINTPVAMQRINEPKKQDKHVKIRNPVIIISDIMVTQMTMA